MHDCNYILDENHEVVEIPIWRDLEPGEEPAEGEIPVMGRVMDVAAMRRWGTWFEKAENRIVRQEHVGPYWVSTVFLGLDHQWNPDRAPLLFETMIFDEEHKVSNDLWPGREFKQEVDLQWRYSTWAEAVSGHEKAVQIMRGWLERASAQVEEFAPDEMPDTP